MIYMIHFGHAIKIGWIGFALTAQNWPLAYILKAGGFFLCDLDCLPAFLPL